MRMTNLFCTNRRITVLFPNNKTQNHSASRQIQSLSNAYNLYSTLASMHVLWECDSLDSVINGALFFLFRVLCLRSPRISPINLCCCYLSRNCGTDRVFFSLSLSLGSIGTAIPCTPWVRARISYLMYIHNIRWRKTLSKHYRHIMCSLHGGLSASIYKKRLKLHAYNWKLMLFGVRSSVSIRLTNT